MEADSLPGINYACLSRVTLSLGTPFHLTRILNHNHSDYFPLGSLDKRLNFDDRT